MSVLRIYNNIVALNANRNLRVTGSMISKSMERLSSGLRINRAADDAAGLAISERLRAQIRGLNRASSNSLDGISLIQTAEGALNETSSILQRIRELSVQAANGVLTSSDRTNIQQEVNQLIDEIDRIAKTTEFNTKTLLDGTMGALVATGDQTILRGSVIDDVAKAGNYVLNMQVIDKGQLQVLKTAPFAKVLEQDAVGSVNYLKTFAAGARVVSAGPTGIGATGLAEVVVTTGTANNITVGGGKDAQFYVTLSLPTATDHAVSAAIGTDIVGNLMNFQDLNYGDYIQFSFVLNNVDPDKVFVAHISYGAAAGVNAIKFNTVASLGGAVSSMLTQAGALALDATTVISGEGQMSINNAGGNITIKGMKLIDGSLGAQAVSLGVESPSKMFFSFAKFGNNYKSNILWGSLGYKFTVENTFANSLASATIQALNRLTLDDGVTDNKIDVRFHTNVMDQMFVADNIANLDGYGGASGAIFKNMSISIGMKVDTIRTSDKNYIANELQQFGKVFQVTQPPKSGTYLVSAITATSYAVYNFDNIKYDASVRQGKSYDQAIADAKGFRFSINGVNAYHVGQAFNGDFADDGLGAGVTMRGVRVVFDATLQAGEQATFDVSTTPVVAASHTDKLQDLNRFKEFGIFQGRENYEFQIYARGSGKSTTVYLSKNDTIEQFSGKISLALADFLRTNDLNLETSISPAYTPDLVHLNTVGLAKGTISITAPLVGRELVFAGDEKLMKMLALTEIQGARNPIYSVTATNIETGIVVGHTQTDSNEVNGLLPGLRLFFEPSWKMKLDPLNPLGDDNKSMTSFPHIVANERPGISINTARDLLFIHVVPRGLTLQIGPNQGQTLTTTIRDLGSEALGIKGLIVTNESMAQDAISRVDVAIDRVTSERSKLGAIQNRLESTIRNLEVASENLTSSESRIRDLDVAAETVQSTRNQILLQAGTAALAQANQLPQNVLQLLR